jgi:predicted PolB exonuclease-like 3'-5' exonuclease
MNKISRYELDQTESGHDLEAGSFEPSGSFLQENFLSVYPEERCSFE